MKSSLDMKYTSLYNSWAKVVKNKAFLLPKSDTSCQLRQVCHLFLPYRQSLTFAIGLKTVSKLSYLSRFITFKWLIPKTFRLYSKLLEGGVNYGI